MPLAGLVLNRTHPPATTALSATRAEGAAEEVVEAGAAGADSRRRRCGCTPSGWRRPAREQHLADRFTSAHPEVAVRTVPAAAGDVHDLDGLRADGRGADRRRRGHADRHAAHAGAARAPRLSRAVGRSRPRTFGAMSENAQSGPLLAKLAATIVVAGALLAGLLLPWVGGTGLVARNSASLLDALPVELTDKTPAGNTRVLAADGSLITNFYENNRTPVTSDQISEVMKQALVDIEDSRFYDHNGLDVQGTLRALVTNVAAGLGAGGRLDAHPAAGQADPAADGADRGGAQAADRAEASAASCARRGLALALEETYSKDEILTRYLNIVYFGQGAYGIQAAAQKYFSVNAIDLTLPQAAMLAGLVQSPTNDDPIGNPENAQIRRNQVLERMNTLGHITDQELADISAQPVAVAEGADPPNGCIDAAIGGFFCAYLLDYLTGTLGLSPDEIDNGGLTIQTTLRPDMQAAGDQAVLNTLPMGDPLAGMYTARWSRAPGTSWR